MPKKILLLCAGVLAALTLLASPVSAQGYEPGEPSATIDDTSVLAGQTVNVSGECYAADSVSLEIEDGPSLGTIPVDDDGTFSGSITIPNLEPGDYTLLLTCGDDVLSTTITVLASGSDGDGTTDVDLGSSGDDSLARTGTSVDGLVKAGGGLLVAGAAVVLFATKRRSATT